MARYVVAVSGGVDSVVLLDMLVRAGEYELIVAHFDHGIRDDSAADARFVGELARMYRLPFVSKREELGSRTSEALARERRYAFLKQVAAEHNAVVVTAHHQDDMVETIAINFIRGTGWRGLAVMGDSTIKRPLLHLSKSRLYRYALDHALEFVEDETNQQDRYLRNQVRKNTVSLDSQVVKELSVLRTRQLVLKHALLQHAKGFLNRRDRYFFIMISDAVAIELLRLVTHSRLSSPQLTRLLYAIKTARSGARLELGDALIAEFTRSTFVIREMDAMREASS